MRDGWGSEEIGEWKICTNDQDVVLQGFEGPAYCHLLDDASVWVRMSFILAYIRST